MIRDRLLDIAPAALLIAPLLVVAHTLTQAAVVRALGVAFHRVALGVGPTIARRGRLEIRAVPISAHIAFLDGDGNPPADGRPYEALPAAQKIALQLSGPALLAALTVPLWLLHDDLGVICLALAVLNVLPVSGTAGGQAALVLLEALRGRPVSDRARVAWLLVSLVGVWGTIGWVFFG